MKKRRFFSLNNHREGDFESDGSEYQETPSDIMFIDDGNSNVSDVSEIIEILKTREVTKPSILKSDISLVNKAKAIELFCLLSHPLLGPLEKNNVENRIRLLINTFSTNALDKLEVSIQNLKKPYPKVHKILEEKYKYLENVNQEDSTYGITVEYIKWMLKLPWGKKPAKKVNLTKIQDSMNKELFGMTNVKEKFLEYYNNIHTLGKNRKFSKIPCLYGPPGVGKTSITKAFAESAGIPFAKINCGGLKDANMLKGDRQVWVSSTPGMITKSIINMGNFSGVILLDEIDKLAGADTYNVMLDILDPSTSAFFDNYLEFDVDISNIIFICTVNDISHIHPAFVDRLKIFTLKDYTYNEKFEILKNFVFPKISNSYGLKLTVNAEVYDFILSFCDKKGMRHTVEIVDNIFSKLSLIRTNCTSNTKKKLALSYNNGKGKDFIGKKFFNNGKLTTKIVENFFSN